MKQGALSWGAPKKRERTEESKSEPRVEAAIEAKEKEEAVVSRAPATAAAVSPSARKPSAPARVSPKRERAAAGDDEVDDLDEEEDRAPLKSAAVGKAESDDESDDEDELDSVKKPVERATAKKKGGVVIGKEAEPPSEDFNPIIEAGWKRGEPVPYRALADTFARIEETSSRLHIISHLANLFRSVIALSPSELLTAIYLSTNQLGPAFEGIELGIGESIIMKAIGETCGKTTAVLKQQYTELGDLGLVAMESRQTQKTLFQPAPLTLGAVFKNFRAIATMSGTKSGNVKCNIVKKLLVAAKDNETRLVGVLCGNVSVLT